MQPFDMCLYNGEECERDSIMIALEDRCLRYGDGAFETLRVTRGFAFQHRFCAARMQASLDMLNITLRASDIVTQAIEWAAPHSDDGVILRIQVSRGSGGRGYAPPADASPWWLAECIPLSTSPVKPATIGVSSIRKIPAACLPAALKHASALNAVLIKQEAQENGWDEAIALNIDGLLSETSSGNVFWMHDGVLCTPSLTCDCLMGSTREALLQNPLIPVQEVEASVAVLADANAVALSNCVWGLWPVAYCAEHNWKWKTNAWEPLQLWLKAHMQGSL